MAPVPADELDKARKLLSNASSSKSTAEARRAFYEQLISICRYPSYDCKSFFGTLVAKHFDEFEDLQDKAIDAILDLCEDDEERVRVIGLKGLGATGKADPRWIRGNVGVLLQLLESPPKELALVHEQLFTFLSIRPGDVFAVMLDDVKSNQDSEGSRRNILDFLTRHAASHLQTIFQDRKHDEAEMILQRGLEDLLPTISSEDKLRILQFLGSLPRLSGKKATADAASKFARTIRKSIKSGSSSAQTAGTVQAFNSYMERNPPMSLMDELDFIADHGVALVDLCLNKRDKAACAMIKRESEGLERGKSSLKGSRGLVADVNEVVLKGLTSFVRYHSDPFKFGQAGDIERILCIIYQLCLVDDRRKSLIGDKDANSLIDLAKEAERSKRKSTDEMEKRVFDNIDRLASVLENYKKSLSIDFVPSWKSLASRPSSKATTAPDPSPVPLPVRPVSESKSDVNGQASKPSIPTSKLPPAVEHPATWPSGHLETAALSRNEPSRPVKAENVAPVVPMVKSQGPVLSDTAPAKTDTDIDTKPTVILTIETKQEAVADTKPDPPTIRPESVARPTPQPPTQSRSLSSRITGRAGDSTSSNLASRTGTFGGVELLGPPSNASSSAQPNSTNPSTSANPTLPTTTTNGESSRQILGAAATSNITSSVTNADPQASTANGTPSQPPLPRSLLDRMSPSGGIKRSREGAADTSVEGQSPGMRSLISRMSPASQNLDQDNAHPAKRSRSLLDRMSSGNISSGPTSSPNPSITVTPFKAQPPPPAVLNISKGISIKGNSPSPSPSVPLGSIASRSQSSPAPPPNLSFIGRASTSRPIPPSSSNVQAPAPIISNAALPPPSASSFNILNRAKQPARSAPPSAALNIRAAASRSPAPTTQAAYDEDPNQGVRRKGRGFNKEDSDGDTIMHLAQPQINAQPPMNARPSRDLFSRLNAR